MKNPYPENLTIEIDREKLLRYLRLSSLRGSVIGLVIVFGAIGFFFGVGAVEGTSQSFVKSIGIGTGIGALVGIGIAVLNYFCTVHFRSKRYAEHLQVRVEGPFLRVIALTNGDTSTDHKLHFRSIVDYKTVQNKKMRRFGVKMLEMATTSGSYEGSLSIVGIKDCDRVRDMLAEIDAQREI